MKINLKKFEELVESRDISKQKHPFMDLLIWNYTKECQYKRNWTEETMMARGLITDIEGNIIARPFKKFFNYEEAVQNGVDIPAEDFEVFDKLDGSLGIVYRDHDDKHSIATRGSFSSTQAIEATKILRKKYPFTFFDEKYTYLFEIIYPENRIVCDYGEIRDLYLLAVLETETGKDMSYEDIYKKFGGIFPIIQRYDGITDFLEFAKKPRDNAEGYVIRFKDGLRLKIKFEEYVRLHRIITGVNAKTIWEILRDGKPMNEILERVPDEFYKWVESTSSKLNSKFKLIADNAEWEFCQVQNMKTRREQAFWLQANSKNPGIVFQMLDKKDPSELIWKLVKPKAEQPFKEDEG